MPVFINFRNIQREPYFLSILVEAENYHLRMANTHIIKPQFLQNEGKLSFTQITCHSNTNM